MTYEIRPERSPDAAAIRELTDMAFRGAKHSSGTEGAIIDALRTAGALTWSLVASMDGEIVGHVAFSPVTFDGVDIGWLGLGPISVRPDLQGKGIGSALINEGVRQLRRLGVPGCVLLGDSKYYQRFGFESDPVIRYQGVPPEYFMRISLDGSQPTGDVAFHSAFSI
ncbi:GNAT family N-acetyltransferase [Paradevosia shaoguanensis]|uniref:GNAT family N-acetyltransferase n=1 Tax=Paradevosia shaoguanensis TaxID=1335043 RepID=UPI003C726196